MAQGWKVQVGQVLRYWSGSGKPQHARVTAVTSQTVVDLQVGTGATKATHAAVARRTARAGTGWYRHASELT